jgi:hypothetical protein
LNSVAYSHSQSKAIENQYKRVWGRFFANIGLTAEEIVLNYGRSNDRKSIIFPKVRVITDWRESLKE